jgi:hypothetical protein
MKKNDDTKPFGYGESNPGSLINEPIMKVMNRDGEPYTMHESLNLSG